MLVISRRGDLKIPEFELERYFARNELDVPYFLSSSDVEGYRMGELLELADTECRRMWENLSLGYTDSAGHPLLRGEISGMYDGMGAEEALVFSGAEEAIFTFMNVVLEPGDHAIVLWPAYQSLYEVARSLGVEVSLLPLEHREGWALDPERLRREVKPNTRAIVVNFPHNPTGYLPDLGTFEAVTEIAREANAYLFSDEVYRFLEHDPAERLPAAAELYEGAVSVGVMSKAFALAGLRIGWAVSQDRDLLCRLHAFKDYTTICPSAPSEILALIALRAREQVLARSMRIIMDNLPHMKRFFDEWDGRLEWSRPRAGCTTFPKLTPNMRAEKFVTGLVEDEGVMLLPGAVYGHDDNHFRLSFGRLDFPEALERLDRFMARRLGRT
jgi:aspartate/methionine/tyrosine aminotransferase